LDRTTAATVVAAVRNSEEAFSRNVDAHDVPLDGAEVQGVLARMLARAEAVSGTRGRDYLEERLHRLKDRWNQAKTGSARLGYDDRSTKKQQIIGLLVPASGARWTDFTVGQSMRETENEINLLVPAGDELFAASYGAPSWSFGGRHRAPNEDDLPDGDELGESTLSRKND
jgi:hypothetical protein